MGVSGDSALIQDSEGNTMFQIRSESMSLNQRRTMVDVHGKIIGQYRHKMLDILPTIYIGTPSNERKISLKSRDVFDSSTNNASISMEHKKVGWVEGNWKATKFSIQIDGTKVATVRRKKLSKPSSKTSLFGAGVDSYTISVTPPKDGKPVDLAYLALLAAAIDELYHWASLDTNEM